jgi:hypothetical protein
MRLKLKGANSMTAEIIKFPGFLILEDRNSVAQAGKVYKSTKTLIADLSREDMRRTFEWRCKRMSYGKPLEVSAVLDYRARLLRDALRGDGGGNRQQGGAA